jgi:hypothetical protein
MMILLYPLLLNNSVGIEDFSHSLIHCSSSIQYTQWGLGWGELRYIYNINMIMIKFTNYSLQRHSLFL